MGNYSSKLRAVSCTVFRKKNIIFIKNVQRLPPQRPLVYMPNSKQKSKSITACAPHLCLVIFMAFAVFLGGNIGACTVALSSKDSPRLYNMGQLSSITEFTSIIKNYTDPRGVLPDLFISIFREHKIEGDFVYNSSFTSYEFFVFDHQRVLLLLSVQPLYFIEIQSPLFYSHCLEQLEQIRAGRGGSSKVIATAPFLKTIGDLNLEIYFAPKEINYASRGSHRGRIRQTGMQRPPQDLWRLFGAAQRVTAYFPDYTDQKMHADIQEQRAKGKIRSIFASHIDLSAEDSAEYLSLLEGPSLAYIHGEGLELTQDLLGDTSIDFVDQSLLLKDFLFLFSFSPGKNLSENTAYEPALNHNNGIVILLRAHKNALEPFLDFITELMQNPKTAAPKQPALLISEIGNKKNDKTSNDYVLLHNPNSFPLTLGGLYLGRDSGCDLENGWSEYEPLPLQWIEPHSYFLVSRKENDLNADWIWNGSLTEHYCIVLSASAFPPALLSNEQIIDSVYFKDLEDKSSYKRQGICQEEDSDLFAADFSKIECSTPPLKKQTIESVLLRHSIKKVSLAFEN